MTAMPDTLDRGSERSRLASEATKVVVWCVALASVVAFYILSRQQETLGFEADPQPHTVEPPSGTGRSSRLFNLEADEFLAVSSPVGDGSLLLEWISGSLSAPRLESWTQQLAGVPISMAMVTSPEPSLLVLVRDEENNTALVQLKLDPAVGSSTLKELVSFSEFDGLGEIVEFEVTQSGGDVLLLYEAKRGSGLYSLVSVEFSSLSRDDFSSTSLDTSMCLARKLATGLVLEDESALDLQVLEDEGRWTVRTQPGGEAIDVDLGRLEFAPVDLGTLLSAG